MELITTCDEISLFFWSVTPRVWISETFIILITLALQNNVSDYCLYFKMTSPITGAELVGLESFLQDSFCWAKDRFKVLINGLHLSSNFFMVLSSKSSSCFAPIVPVLLWLELCASITVDADGSCTKSAKSFSLFPLCKTGMALFCDDNCIVGFADSCCFWSSRISLL